MAAEEPACLGLSTEGVRKRGGERWHNTGHWRSRRRGRHSIAVMARRFHGTATGVGKRFGTRASMWSIGDIMTSGGSEWRWLRSSVVAGRDAGIATVLVDD